MAQVVKHLPSKTEVLSSDSRSTKEKIVVVNFCWTL
jgi:hypothetical protein